MNKWVVVVIVLVVVVAIAFYASSITGNGILDWFKGKSTSASLSPKKIVKAGINPGSNPLTVMDRFVVKAEPGMISKGFGVVV